MRYRTFARMGWRVAEVGYGMWGMSGWTGSDDVQSRRSLEAAVARGINFFDTAQGYGEGHSELLLGRLIAAHPDKRLYVATRIPPRDRKWNGQPGRQLSELYPREHIRRAVDVSAANLGLAPIPLLLLQGWDPDWLRSGELARTVAELRREGLIRAFGVSLGRGQAEAGVAAVKSGFVDAIVTVYNVFDQAAEDELLPACQREDVAVIVRAPLDEGSLAGALTPDTAWPSDDWRSAYFAPPNLEASIARVGDLWPLVPPESTLAQMAIRFVLSNPCVTTVIPGMRQVSNVDANALASDAGPLPPDLLDSLRDHRWDRDTTVDGW
jgi:aryl-alcohol dehydrogenase-like predicted oxidoreductase